MIHETSHSWYRGDSRLLKAQEPCADLLLSSPPYPMVEMWDSLFSEQDPALEGMLQRAEGLEAFELMHRNLDQVWAACDAVLKPGAWVAINMGDATRRLGNDFRLYQNHARCAAWFTTHGYRQVPTIIWKKTTNAPNKFMGSGMLPKGAYVTLEHEYILVFRKPGQVTQGAHGKTLRRASALFWEERNTWFSDLWDCSPSKQELTASRGRTRSAAFPFQIPWRLVHMYSQQGDTILDPFAGTGTTSMAAMAAGRNSIAIDLLADIADKSLGEPGRLAEPARGRLLDHEARVLEESARGKSGRYLHPAFASPVHSRQELSLSIPLARSSQGLVPGEHSLASCQEGQVGLELVGTWQIAYDQVLKATR